MSIQNQFNEVCREKAEDLERAKKAYDLISDETWKTIDGLSVRLGIIGGLDIILPWVPAQVDEFVKGLLKDGFTIRSDVTSEILTERIIFLGHPQIDDYTLNVRMNPKREGSQCKLIEVAKSSFPVYQIQCEGGL